MALTYPPLLDQRSIRLLTFKGFETGTATPIFTLDVSPGQIPRTGFVGKHPTLRVDGSTPSFRALSYVWGDPSLKQRIICNGQALDVTYNLYRALRQLGPQYPDLPIWADALCINQNDNVEKAGQVAMMGDVYAAAQDVLCWLGVSDPLNKEQKEGKEDEMHDYQRSFDEYRRIRAQNSGKKLCEACKTCRYSLFGGRSSCEDPLHVQTAAACPGLADAVRLMAKSPWFERAWTFQELVRARQATMHLGPYSLAWDDFASTQLELSRPYKGSWGTLRLPETPLNRLEEFLRHYAREGGASFAGCVLGLRDRKSTLPHDRVYAAMGLSANLPSGMLPVDYSITMRQLEAAVTQFIVLEDGTPGALGDLPRRRNRELGDRPSWAVELGALKPAGYHMNVGKLADIKTDKEGELGLHCLLVGYDDRLDKMSANPFPGTSGPAPLPLPECVTRGRVKLTTEKHSWAESEHVARIDGLRRLFEASMDPEKSYDKLRAHREKRCACQPVGSGSADADSTVYWVALLANPAGWMAGRPIVVEQTAGNNFALRGYHGWVLRWFEELGKTSEEKGPLLYGSSCVFTTIKLTR